MSAYFYKPSRSPLPYLLNDLLYYTLQNGSHSLNNLLLIEQLSVHLIMRPLRRETLHSAHHRTKKEHYCCCTFKVLHSFVLSFTCKHHGKRNGVESLNFMYGVTQH